MVFSGVELSDLISGYFFDYIDLKRKFGFMKSRYLVWLLLLFFCSCNKSIPTPTNQFEPFSFTTQYDSIFTCYANSQYDLVFNVQVLSGNIDTNPISYSITGLPVNITALPTSQTVGYVLGGAFTLNIGNVPVGSDTADLIISSAVNGTQTHKLVLNIIPPFDYSPKLAGAYNNAYDYCQPSGNFYNYSSVVSTVTDTPYEIKITNIKNLGPGFVVRALVSNVITIPLQTIGAYTISGSGTFTHDNPPYDSLYQMAINDTIINGTDVEHCILHIQH